MIFYIRRGDLGSVGLVVGAPVVLVNGSLASRASTPRRATGSSGGTLSVAEVKGLGQDDDAGGGVGKVGDKLGGGGRVDGSGATTTGGSLGEALSGARDGVGCESQGGEGSQCHGEKSRSHIWKAFEQEE